MRSTALLAVAVALTACNGDPWAEPSPPRPATLRLVLAGDDGVAVTTAGAVIDEIHLEHCHGQPGRTILRALVSLETTAPYLVEGGWWCGVEVDLEPPIELTAEGPDGSTLVAELDVPSIEIPLEPSMYVDGQPFLLQVGTEGWLSDAGLAFTPGEELDVAAGDPGHDALVEDLEERSALWLDVGADGVLGSDEEHTGPLATGPEREP